MVKEYTECLFTEKKAGRPCLPRLGKNTLYYIRDAHRLKVCPDAPYHAPLIRQWIEGALIIYKGKKVRFRIFGKRSSVRSLLLINISRQMGFDRNDPAGFLRRQIEFMPDSPREITEADFGFGEVFQSKNTGELHLQLRATRGLIEYAKWYANRGGNRDSMVLPLANGNIPIFYASRRHSDYGRRSPPLGSTGKRAATSGN